ncbi:MAG TPA: iron ABC transporter permease [Porphyromonadaceae bacterium]|jgi:iron complex transport system permease protein|uniref:FecCD family ABC transporter permease n=1 Tax=Petrimonas TaxID=307628 RepID=UPI000E9935E7|nr:iron ABC transporter permease [Petrimonas sp.]HAC73203.1 iron ABC transporter permease [Porphyromonadaceae bacterium]MDD4014589.1 iron ABC transporter permease [Petrimonas sp.]MDD4536098.1 iron ABC transporter permease [Petrimonas sp.]MDX9775454.1 iron ABC transporter permease [Petrimonas sp.]
MSKKLIWFIYVLLFLVALSVVIILSLSIGEIPIPYKKIPQILADKESMEYGVLFYIRIPRTLLGFAIGGSLSLAGAILQGIYRNPLVEPYTLGISGGASLGVTFAIVAGLHLLNILLLPLAGFIGAFTTIFLVYTLSLKKGALSVNRMLLIGVMISFISSSLMMFLMSITATENIHGIVFWIMGSLNESNTAMIGAMVVLSIVCLLISYLFVMPLNALRLGEEKARHLGINSNATIRILFVITSVLTGACIAVGGVIGFVGLVIPHIVRLFVGSDYRIMLVSSFLSGSIFLILCDIIARTIISPNELPIGVITGIVGGVVFIVLLSRSQKRSKLLRI